MNIFFACTTAVVLALLLIVWLGPRFANRLLCWHIDRTNKKIRQFQERRNERHEEIRVALELLRQHTEGREK